MSVAHAKQFVRAGKRRIFHCAESLGLAAIMRNSAWRRRRLAIICYHGVSLTDEHEWSDLYVSQAHLRRRFEHLRRRGYNVLPLSKALEGLWSGSLPPKSVALTFDDGAYDFLARACPLLQEFGYHATLYLTTFYCEFQRPVFDTIASYLLWKGQGRTVRLPGELGGTIVVPTDETIRSSLHLELRRRVNELCWDAEEKDELARALSNQVGVDYESILRSRLLHLLRPEEVRSLNPRHVSVQLHTHRHRTPRDERLFMRELTDNRAALVKMRPADSRFEHFCYPSGDYDPLFLPWLAAAGVTSATTCEIGIAGPDSSAYLLPRIVDSMNVADEFFEGWLCGAAALLSRGSTRRARKG